MRSLFDVNVLLALLDTGHLDHDRATAWIRSQESLPWASCPITENGFVRVISQPRYPKPISIIEGVALLQGPIRNGDHEFWPDAVSVLDDQTIRSNDVLGPRQLTDSYLLALAVSRGGRLVTLDRRITTRPVVGALAEHLVVL